MSASIHLSRCLLDIWEQPRTLRPTQADFMYTSVGQTVYATVAEHPRTSEEKLENAMAGFLQLDVGLYLADRKAHQLGLPKGF